MLSEFIGGPDIFAELPKCKAFYEAFKTLPTLKNYFASEAYKMELNSRGANVYFA
jgi:hypothetical protein